MIPALKTAASGMQAQQMNIDTIANKELALVDGLEGRKSLELISAIYESIETGREVSLKFRPRKCRLGLPEEA